MSKSRQSPKGQQDTTDTKVVDLFTGKPLQSGHAPQIVRLAPELDGFEALYSDTHGTPVAGQQVFSVNVLFWALLSDGNVVGLIPWYDTLLRCPELNHPETGFFIGYFDPGIDDYLAAPPEHKRAELKAAANYFSYEPSNEKVVLQELPDTCGTHAIFSSHEDLQNFTMSEVFSWRLLSDGSIQAMVINLREVKNWPVLLGDQSLAPCDDMDDFRCFFQYRIAVKIKQQDEELQNILKDFKQT